MIIFFCCCCCRLAKNISIVVDDPDTAYPSIRAVWLRFEPYFIGVLGAVNYLPVFSDYLWRTLEEFLEDGVQYSEIRFTVEVSRCPSLPSRTNIRVDHVAVNMDIRIMRMHFSLGHTVLP